MVRKPKKVLVKQPNANPTRKLSAATIAAALVGVLQALAGKFAPSFAGPEVWGALLPIVVFVVGYFVKDEPNVVAAPVVEAHETDL